MVLPVWLQGGLVVDAWWRPLPSSRSLPNACGAALCRAAAPFRREWADFDEKLGESVSIMGVSSEFKAHKK